MADKKLKIVLADDHPLWISGIKKDLERVFEIVGEASDAFEAVEVVKTTNPDVVVSDLNMERGGGTYVVKQCSNDFPVLILTASDHERDLLDVVSLGAMGYILKTATADELINAINNVHIGVPAITPHLAACVLTEFRKISSAQNKENKGALSDREKEVLKSIAKGMSYKSIGEELFISPKTVENHMRNIMSKLHLKGRDELMNYIQLHNIDE